MTRATFGVVILTALLGGSAAAADQWRHLTPSDGLPGKRIQFLNQDARGTVWVGTLSGLARFEGGSVSATPIKAKTWDVLRAGPDRYWAGTQKGVVRVNGEKRKRWLKPYSVSHLVAVKDHGMLALAKHRKNEKSTLMAYREGDWGVVEALESEHTDGLMKRDNGEVWVSIEGDGVAVLRPDPRWRIKARHLKGQSVTTMMEDSKGRVWCGLWQRGIMVHGGNGWQRHLGDTSAYIYDIVETPSGVMWASSDQSGLWRYNGEKWINDLREEGGVNMLAVTSDGRVWVSTQAKGGLRYWNGKKWVRSLPGPLPIRCILETKDGTLLAGGVLSGLYVRKKPIPQE